MTKCPKCGAPAIMLSDEKPGDKELAAEHYLSDAAARIRNVEFRYIPPDESKIWGQGFEDGKQTKMAVIQESTKQEATELLKLFRVRLEGSRHSREIDERVIQLLQTLKD